MSLGAIVLTRNSAQAIEELVKSLSFADEVLVIDDFSEDATPRLAKKLGATVVQRRLDNFAAQRNFALTQTKADWVLFIDADERVSKKLAAEILKVIRTEGGSAAEEIVAYKIPRKNKIFGRVIRHTGWHPDERIVLFQRDQGRYHGAVHETVKIAGRVGCLTEALDHDNYQDLDQYLTKAVKYSQIAARDLIGSGYRFRWQDLVEEPFEEFIRRYFAWEGYRDGLHGLALSLLQAFTVLQVYLRVWQQEQFNPQDLTGQELNEVVGAKTKVWQWWTARIKTGNGLITRLRSLVGR